MAIDGGATEGRPFVQRESPDLRTTQTRSILNHGIEDGFKHTWRTGNDLEHLRGRRLLLQRLSKIVCALPQFVEQPRVLDSDDRLRGEVLDHSNLLVREWPDFLAENRYGADQLAFL